MLSLVDCIAFSGLTPDQLDAVACFKHLPPILAAEWAEGTLEREGGCADVESILIAEVATASAGHRDCARRWRAGLEQFRREHPGS